MAVNFDQLAFVAGEPRPFSVVVAGPGGRLGNWVRRTAFSDMTYCPPASSRTRIYFGQPDPVDASHFTIGYDAGGVSGTIDGWLLPDDTVRLTVRDGPAAAGG